MKLLKFIILSIVLSGCAKQVDINLSGNTQVKDKDIWIVGENFDEKAEISEDNTFYLPTHIPEKGLYAILIGQHRQRVILDPNSLTQVKISENKNSYQFNFTGGNSKENNAIAKFSTKVLEVFPSESELIKYEPKVALAKVKEGVENLKKQVPEELYKLAIESMEKEIIYKGGQLQNSYRRFANMDRKEIGLGEVDVSQIPLPKINYDLGMDRHHYDTYNGLLVSKLNVRVRNELIKDVEKSEKFKELIAETKSEEVKELYAEYFSYSMSIHNEYNTEFYEALIPHLKGKKKDLATSKYNSYQSIKRGVDSPEFELPDINGKIYTNKDLAGNVILIDLWATWCRPCIKEFPHLKKIEQEYKGKEFKLVGISVDQPADREKWKSMIIDKELNGIQLIAEKGWESKFAKAYGINSIPRFILLGKDGKIIDADAPKPRDIDEIKALIDKHI